MTAPTIGVVVHDFFLDYLPQQKGLRPSSIRSYRDTLRLFLVFAAGQCRRGVTQLTFDDLGFERVLAFLRDLEQTRRNAIATRNQRLAGLHTFYEYVGRRLPEMLRACAQVAAIPVKRCPLPETRFMARDEVDALFAKLPAEGRLALRDRTMLLFLYNTGARVSEVAGLRVDQLSLTTPAHVRLLGKGGKWRSCPLWNQTAQVLQQLLAERGARRPDDCVFAATTGEAMTRFGIYKRVRRLVGVNGCHEALFSGFEGAVLVFWALRIAQPCVPGRPAGRPGTQRPRRWSCDGSARRRGVHVGRSWGTSASPAGPLRRRPVMAHPVVAL